MFLFGYFVGGMVGWVVAKHHQRWERWFWLRVARLARGKAD
ncbi:MAG: hypothetical protein G01um101419_602 [Parcubacteria group bacterium Gr01-1014_19]|nr:MAG: hypothetical protein G01um101419_602 [Parcubacteria group bacterium Gr01-1014_19]